MSRGRKDPSRCLGPPAFCVEIMEKWQGRLAGWGGTCLSAGQGNLHAAFNMQPFHLSVRISYTLRRNEHGTEIQQSIDIKSGCPRIVDLWVIFLPLSLFSNFSTMYPIRTSKQNHSYMSHNGVSVHTGSPGSRWSHMTATEQ